MVLEESTSILVESYGSSRSLLFTLEYYCGVIWTIMGVKECQQDCVTVVHEGHVMCNYYNVIIMS